jgi:RNA 2',3'-cyclic 3'-phosphodiesterase
LAEVRTLHPQVRWVPPNKLHLTLVFLGATPVDRVDSIAAAVAAVAGVAAGHAPFDVATGAAGGRVSGRGGVAWLRLARGGQRVAQLALALDDAIGSHTYDDRHAPRPHLTVARGATEHAVRDLSVATDGMRLTWRVDRVVLFRSHTERAGSRYEELFAASLG